MTLFFILLATFLVSLISFCGVLTLLLKEEWLNKILLILVAFSAGSLLGGAFFHLLPEAIEDTSDPLKVFLFAVIGFVTFFILENFIHWHHHHVKSHPEAMPFSYLLLISDGIHNFIDGLVIAASFVVSFPFGLATAIIVALHEIPQEIGDFGVLIYGGFKKTTAVFLNFLSAVTAMLGGIVGFLLWEKIGPAVVFLLPLAAGNFIYIASSDLIPEIKQKTTSEKSIAHFLAFLFGVALMLILKLIWDNI